MTGPHGEGVGDTRFSSLPSGPSFLAQGPLICSRLGLAGGEKRQKKREKGKKKCVGGNGLCMAGITHEVFSLLAMKLDFYCKYSTRQGQLIIGTKNATKSFASCQ